MASSSQEVSPGQQPGEVYGSTGGGQGVSRWQIIHPQYINSNCTLAEGRRIPKAKAVENPTIQEMVDSCNFLKVPVVPEPYKAYPRDFFDRGRIRVQLKDSKGTPLNSEIPNKVALMLKLGALIPKHQSRTRKDGGGKKEAEKGGAEGPKEKKGKSGKKKR